VGWLSWGPALGARSMGLRTLYWHQPASQVGLTVSEVPAPQKLKGACPWVPIPPAICFRSELPEASVYGCPGHPAFTERTAHRGQPMSTTRASPSRKEDGSMTGLAIIMCRGRIRRPPRPPAGSKSGLGVLWLWPGCLANPGTTRVQPILLAEIPSTNHAATTLG